MNTVEKIEDVISNIQNCAAGEYDIAALESVLGELAAPSAKPVEVCRCVEMVHRCERCGEFPADPVKPEQVKPVVSAFSVPVPSTYGPDGWTTEGSRGLEQRPMVGRHPGMKSAKPELPEVDEWIADHTEPVEDCNEYMRTTVELDALRAYLHQLTAAHKAAMAEKDAQYSRLQREFGAALVEAAQKGRREPMQEVQP